MIDFSKLVNMTEESRAEAEKRVAESHQEYLRKIEELRQERLALIERLIEPGVIGLMRPPEAEFVRDMHRMGHAYDHLTKSEGGRLTSLSSAQVTFLSRIAQAYLRPPGETPSRAQRFRGG